MARRALIFIESSSNGSRYVKAAKNLDLLPFVMSSDPTRYDYLAAEGIEAICVDTDNLDALIRECSRLAENYDIAGITGFPNPGEWVYATAGRLCRHFDLPGPNPASIEQCSDKFIQLQLLAEAGVPLPLYRLAADAADVKSAAAEIGLPVVLKPAVGNASSGVRLCRNVDELKEHTTYLLGGKHVWRFSPRILVEEFAQGPYYCSEIMGDEVIGIYGGEVGPEPYFVFREYTLPALLTDEEQERIVELSLTCLRALGLGWGPTCIEFRWTNRGPVVIEVNPRLGGVPGPQLVQLTYGLDLVTEHIKLVIGEESNLRRMHSRTAAARFLIPDRDGTLDWISGDSRAAAIPGVAEVTFYVEPKTPIVRKGDLGDWIGCVIAASATRAQTEAILQEAVDLIGWSIAPFPTP